MQIKILLIIVGLLLVMFGTYLAIEEGVINALSRPSFLNASWTLAWTLFVRVMALVVAVVVVVWLVLPFVVINTNCKIDKLNAKIETTNTLLENIHTVANTALTRVHEKDTRGQ